MRTVSIPYGHQSISQGDVEAVIEILRSDWLTQGPTVDRFEKAVAEYCGAKYAVAVNSGTSALHLACLALEVGSGDLLWTSPNTFVASSNCALYCRAEVNFVDINPCTYNMSIEDLTRRLKVAEKQSRIPKVIIPVHFAGQSCEMASLSNLAKHYGCFVIEDASHAIGGKYRGDKMGSCAYSEITVFSFHPVKIITTGEGGMLLTNRIDLYEKMVRLRSHGLTRDADLMEGACHGPWYYQQIALGFNYRMTDIQAALGLSQIKRIEEFVNRRRFLAERYNKALKGLPLILPWQHPDTESAFHLYVVRLKLGEVKKTHRQVFEELREAGIGVNLHYIPVHTQPYYQKLGFKNGDFRNAEEYYREAMSIPIYYDLTESEQDFVIEKLREVLA